MTAIDGGLVAPGPRAAPPAETRAPRVDAAPRTGLGSSLWSIAAALAAALALDLVVTRFLLRLAIFVPKSAATAAVVEPVARSGAVVENLVAVLGFVLLGLVVLAAVHRGGSVQRRAAGALTLWRIGVAASVVVGAGGLALLGTPQTPELRVGLGFAVAVAALAFVPAAASGRRRVEAAGLGLLAAGLATAGLGRALEAAASLLGPDPSVGPAVAAVVLPGSLPTAALGLTLGGQVAYVAGALAVALAGLGGGRPMPGRRRWLVAGCLVAAVGLLAAIRAPATTGMLAIWTLGLSGIVPAGLVAGVVGLAVAGLGPVLAAEPRRALGPLLVLLAGAAPATSALVLAALGGLALAGATAYDSRPAASAATV